MEKRYYISDASQMSGLETHVLRYWEEELGLSVPRNEMGHRYYLPKHIELFKKIKYLKDQGYQLKAIKTFIKDEDMPLVDMVASLEAPARALIPKEDNNVLETGETFSKDEKLARFQKIIGNIVAAALKENNPLLGEEIGTHVSDKVIKEMDYCIRMKEEADEERFKKIDDALREHQKSMREVATAKEDKKRSVFHFKKKN